MDRSLVLLTAAVLAIGAPLFAQSHPEWHR
jgi:hypothetical protein